MFSEILFCLFVAVFTVGSAQYQANRICKKQDDCILPFECCSKRAFVPEAYCVSRRQLGELCLDFGLDQEMVNGTYDITCPCAIGLDCVKPKYYDSRGQLMYTRNPRCQAVGYVQPPLEYYKNLDRPVVYASNGNAYASAGNNAYGNRGNNAYASNGNNAYASNGNNAYASNGNNAYASNGNNAYAASENNAYAPSGNNVYYTDGNNAYGNNVYASSGGGSGYVPQSNAVAYAV